MQLSRYDRHSGLSFPDAWRTTIALQSVLITALWLIGPAGCNGTKTGPATVTVIGTVTLDGTPIEGASVLFSPDIGSDDQRLASQAMTDGQGKFTLSTHMGGGKFKVGIVPGKYVVTISKLDTAAAKNTFSTPKNLLPPKYADPKSSQLKAEVTIGKPNDYSFALKSE